MAALTHEMRRVYPALELELECAEVNAPYEPIRLLEMENQVDRQLLKVGDLI